jgi:hypothetical protein
VALFAQISRGWRQEKLLGGALVCGACGQPSGNGIPPADMNQTENVKNVTFESAVTFSPPASGTYNARQDTYSN